jgi:hypothetical protein
MNKLRMPERLIQSCRIECGPCLAYHEIFIGPGFGSGYGSGYLIVQRGTMIIRKLITKQGLS